jgi:hypothetical protein
LLPPHLLKRSGSRYESRQEDKKLGQKIELLKALLESVDSKKALQLKRKIFSRRTAG